jgi:hypothetical protein
VRKFQIGKNLLLVDAGEGLEGFQLYQNYVSNNQIRTKAFIESLPAKANWNWLLSLYTKPTLSNACASSTSYTDSRSPGPSSL